MAKKKPRPTGLPSVATIKRFKKLKVKPSPTLQIAATLRYRKGGKLTDEVLAFAIKSRCRCRWERFIVNDIMGKWPHIKSRTAWAAMEQARTAIREIADVTVEEAVADAVGFYQSVIADDLVNWKNRLYARERLDKLYGLEGRAGRGSAKVLRIPMRRIPMLPAIVDQAPSPAPTMPEIIPQAPAPVPAPVGDGM